MKLKKKLKKRKRPSQKKTRGCWIGKRLMLFNMCEKTELPSRRSGKVELLLLKTGAYGE